MPRIVRCSGFAKPDCVFQGDGNADAEQNVTLTTASVQRLASLSKPITGTIIMDLVEQGKLSLDSSVRQGVSP